MATNAARVWTRCHRPFVMGGHVYADVAVEVETRSVIEVEGYQIGRILHPDGRSFYVDMISGGLLGSDFDMICEDIRESSKDYLDKQLQEMKERGEKAEEVDAEKFWEMLP